MAFETAVLGFFVSLGEIGLVQDMTTAYTALGSFYLLPLYGLLLYLFGRKAKSYLYLATGAVTGILVYGIKEVVARSRPEIALIEALGFSFPSGHAAMAFVTATVLTDSGSRERKWFLGLATIVALTRLILGVHYPLDIVAGGLLGYGIGTFAVRKKDWLV